MGGDVPCDVERCCQVQPPEGGEDGRTIDRRADSAEVARLRRGFLGQLMLPDQDGYHRL